VNPHESHQNLSQANQLKYGKIIGMIRGKDLGLVRSVRERFVGVNGMDGKVNQVLKKNRRGTEYIEVNGVIISKRCSGCREMMELENFPNLKAGLGGTRSKCRPCLVEYGKKYNEKRPEYTKRYYKKHGEQVRERAREYYARRNGK